MNDELAKATNESPESNTDTEELQKNAAGSPALDDPEIDDSRVTTLPGTGGPDDEGDIDMDPGELNL